MGEHSNNNWSIYSRCQYLFHQAFFRGLNFFIFFLMSRWCFRNFLSAAAPFSCRETTGNNYIFELKAFCLVLLYEADVSVISLALLVVLPFGDSVFLFRPDGPGPYNLNKIVNAV